MTLLNERDGMEDELDGAAGPTGSALAAGALSAAAAELQTTRSGPELDEARTAPVAIVTDGAPAAPKAAPAPAPGGPSPLEYLLRAGVTEQCASFLAVAGLLLAVLLAVPWVGAVAAVVAVALPLLSRTNLEGLARLEGPTGKNTLARVLLAVSVALLQPEPVVVAVAVAVLLAGAVLLEPVLARVAAAAPPYASNLPGLTVRNDARFAVRRVFVVNAAAVVAAAGLALAGAPALLALVPALVAVGVTGAALLDAAGRVRSRKHAERHVAGLVAAYAPKFALHWDAPPGTEYQVTMWLPYLKRIGAPFILIVRNAKSFEGIAAATDVPVLVRTDPRDLDAVVAPSMRAVFYVNNAARNTHLIRFTGLTHVQLNHGESDKAPSYSPVFRLYDKDFVAGQAAIDRFAANGVRMPAELFTIVGRPQIEHIDVGTSRSAEKTALYAPTWGGANADSDYCSLPIGVKLVESLIKRGYTVIFRPHPYTRRNADHARQADRILALLAADRRDSGRAHVFGDAATAAMSLVDCFNAADLLVSDVSSVVPDFLYSEKPFAVAAMQGTVSEFAKSFPIAKAAYVLDRRGRNIEPVLDSMVGLDPLLPARRKAKTYFLGDFPAESYADGFLDEARAVVLGRQRVTSGR